MIDGAAGRTLLDGGPTTSAHLADLAAYHALAMQASDLPSDSPALRRFALYLLLPLGSWVASSVVQHVVERMLSGQ